MTREQVRTVLDLMLTTSHTTLCETERDAIRTAVAMLKEQEVHKFFVDESGKVTPLPVVVRCKDCKKRDSWECWQYFFGRIKIPDDWFCADAERKSD